LARRLPEWRPYRDRLAVQPLGPGATASLLRRHGFVIEVCYGFNGPRSIALGAFGRALERLGRPDLADRCEALMRATYLETGPLARFTSVRLFVARRTPNDARSAGQER
jgi:hypothetical protein